MNDIRLTTALAKRAEKLSGVERVGSRNLLADGLCFKVYADSGAIFNVAVTVYKDAIQ